MGGKKRGMYSLQRSGRASQYRLNAVSETGSLIASLGSAIGRAFQLTWGPRQLEKVNTPWVFGPKVSGGNNFVRRTRFSLNSWGNLIKQPKNRMVSDLDSLLRDGGLPRAEHFWRPNKRRSEYLAQLMLHDDLFDWPEHRSGACRQNARQSFRVSQLLSTMVREVGPPA